MFCKTRNDVKFLAENSGIDIPLSAGPLGIMTIEEPMPQNSDTNNASSPYIVSPLFKDVLLQESGRGSPGSDFQDSPHVVGPSAYAV